MSYQDIIVEREKGVATITLNRPERLNAFSPEMRVSLFRAIEEVSDDSEVRAVIITGAGRGFCTGYDWSLGASQNPADLGLGESHRLDPLGWLGLRIHQLDKPTIAAVNGVAAGGGFGLMLVCDFRIASENSRMGPVFIRRGLSLDWGISYFLPRLIGLSRALELAMTGEMIDAQEAERIGLVNRVVPADELLAAAKELAAKLAKGPPIGLHLTKRSIYRAQTMNLMQALDYESYAQSICFQTEDVQEGIRAFLEKREPEFKGR
ncbi:MAG: enoyl-CoA hydratase [Deltaproteobacteria bacterium]|nr:enoyl-CoA hydratase [Deltaproteobacteria bacterium]